ncbi:hypothetical protein A2Z22_00835 [Candidatus Woesebacteria bacterium RBG_16_34_12]|uniref:HD/PDEase domain-containing protein n=1 Tax=Candidatus Woesebacteria bacterium RBG_16_34_12 TaxID=1802480 RepID=A0A1F7X8P2_9BACT|nr:MAG: hypothetical protein A2Z22_00835 [Candidatus Woesebacteria bacterium RBG_16_34_12]
MNTFLNLKFQESRFLKNIDQFKKMDKAKIIKAYKLAKKYHSGQKRDEGGPYLLHCLRVACLIIEELDIKDSSVICAAILHDSVEDTKLTLEEIKEKFGIKTSELVSNLTRNRSEETELNKYKHKYKKFKETMKKDWETRAIKACDYLDNMMSWSFIPEYHPSRNKFPRWFTEAETMYIPLAKSVDRELVIKMKKVLISIKGT